VRPSGSLRHFLGSFASIIAGLGLGQTTYPTVRICAATSGREAGGAPLNISARLKIQGFALTTVIQGGPVRS
jgi:hypothetical protein